VAQFAQIDRSITRNGDTNENSSLLNSSLDAPHSLVSTFIERHGNAQECCQLPHAISLGDGERPVEPVVRLRRGFSVITHQASNRGLLVFAKAWNIRVTDEIFTVLVVGP